MIADITSAVTGILTAVGTLITPDAGSNAAVAYVALLALPVLGGTVAMARRLIKKAR